MNINSARWVLLFAFVLTGSASFAEELETISRPDIAAANCPAEWAALSALEPDLWADTNPIGIDPSFDQTATDAFNKYFLWTMAQADHVASIIGMGDSNTDTQSYFDGAKAKYDLSSCLTMTPAERDLVVETYHARRPSKSEDGIRVALFKAFDDYECMGFAQASARIFRLDPQSASFQPDYQEIMSTTLNDCG